MQSTSNLFLGMDIDWFAIDLESKVIHFASGGGVVPNTIDEERNKNVTQYFRSLPEIPGNEIIFSSRANEYKSIFGKKQFGQYSSDFVFMAKRGLYSFDKVNVGNWNDPFYYLVAAPSKLLSYDDLPENIRISMGMTKVKGIVTVNAVISMAT